MRQWCGRDAALKEIVLETIRRFTKFARNDPDRFAAYNSAETVY